MHLGDLFLTLVFSPWAIENLGPKSEKARAKRQSKMPLQTAPGGISRESLKRRSPNFTLLSGMTGPTQVPDMTSPVACGRLQNVTKYLTKVTRETGPAGQSQIIRPLFNQLID